jgi:hypothetical protein
MSAPFDTLKLARRFEAAGFDPKQAGDMAEAIAEATVSADLVTNNTLEKALLRQTIRFGVMMVTVATVLFAALHWIPPAGHT